MRTLSYDRKIAVQMGVLRGRVEATLRSPAVINVTSAKERDGKTLLSFGLSGSLASGGYRVLLLAANPRGREPVDMPRVTTLRGVVSRDVLRVARRYEQGGFDVLSFADESVAAGISIGSLATVATLLRQEYDYVVVDNAADSHTNLNALFSEVSDGTLVAIREGRSIGPDDERLKMNLDASPARLIGIVSIGGRAIKSFAKRGVHVEPAAVPATKSRVLEEISQVRSA